MTPAIQWTQPAIRLIANIALGITFATILAGSVSAQTPSPALLVLEKEDQMLAIVDPASLKIVGRVAAGADPHAEALHLGLVSRPAAQELLPPRFGVERWDDKFRGLPRFGRVGDEAPGCPCLAGAGWALDHEVTPVE